MKADLLASELINNLSKESDTLYKQYHTTLSTLIDKHAPLHTKHTKVKYISGWVNETSTCRKSTSTIESACRPNLNSLKQKFRIITKTHKNYGVSWVMCYTDKIEKKMHSTFSASVNSRHITPDSPPPPLCFPLFLL